MCFGGGGSAPGAPDLSSQSGASSAIGNSAQSSAAAQQQWAGQNVQNQMGVTGQAQGTLAGQAGNSFGAGAQGQQTYGAATGAQAQNLAMAQNWGSPAGVASARANAAATTGQAYDAARMNNQRQLAAYGVDPSQLKSGALNLQGNLAQAGATGTNVYNAGQQRQLQGFGMTGQAIGQGGQLAQLGQGYTGQGASMTGQGVQLGNQSLATGSQALLAPSQWDQTALAGYGQSANINTQQFQNSLANAQYSNQVNTAQASGMGNLVGMAGGLVADYFTAADGGGIPPRGGRRYYDDGGDVDVPQQGQGAQAAGPSEKIDTGGTDVSVGMTEQEKQQAGQQAFMGGAAKGFLKTYKAFDDGGSINVPNIVISPVSNPGITHGGAAAGQKEMTSPNQAGTSGMMGGIGALGGMFGGGGGGGAGGGMADIAGQAAGADGGRIGVPPRKKQSPPNGAHQTVAQNPAQRAQPGLGDAGPMTFGNGGMAEVNPNPQRMGGVPQPHYQRPMVNMLPSAQRLRYAHMADGNQVPPMPDRTYADGGHEGGTFVSQGASDGTGIDDQVPARVSVGEYVIPADVVHHKGKEFFDKLISKYHTPADQQRQQMGVPRRMQ